MGSELILVWLSNEHNVLISEGVVILLVVFWIKERPNLSAKISKTVLLI